jgi:ATP-binding cassette subfamily B protein
MTWAEAPAEHITIRYRPGASAERDLARVQARALRAWDGTLAALGGGDSPPSLRLTITLDDEIDGSTDDDHQLLVTGEPPLDGAAATEITLAYHADAPAGGLERAIVKRLLAHVIGGRSARSTALIDGLTGHVLAADTTWNEPAPPLAVADVLDGLDRGESRDLYFRSATCLVSWLLARHGQAQFCAFAHALDPADASAACLAVYGRDPAELDHDFRAELVDTTDADGALGVADVVRELVRYLRPYWPQVLLIGAGLLLDMAFTTAVPLSFRALIDSAIAPRNGALLVTILAGLIVLGLVAAAAGLGRDYLYARLAARVLNDLRLRMFERLNGLSMSYFARTPAADVLSRFTTDLAAVEQMITSALPTTVLALLNVVVGVALLLALEWRLALVVIVATPLGIVAPRVLAGRAAKASYLRKRDEARVATTVGEIVGAQAVVKSYGLLGLMTGRFRELLDGLLKSSQRVGLLAALVERSAVIALLVIELAVVTAGAVLAFHGALSVGSLLAFHALFRNVADYASSMIYSLPSLLHASGGLRRIRELVDAIPEVADVARAQPLARLAARIELDGVSFAHGDGRNVLDGVSVTVRKGESVAIVGPSGSGKSTLLNLLLRFHEPTGGRVMFDGVDVRTASSSSLFGQLATVFQDPVLFDASLYENIRMGRLDATREDIAAAATAADLDDLIASLPQGWDTPLGERGNRLSGGQRQRVAIARALVRDPSVLVLDEATSALDADTEGSIHAALARLARGRTTVSVTHRLARCVDADRVVVLERGRLVEQGTHTELLAGGGVYANLWAKQHAFADARDPTALDPERLRAISVLGQIPTEALRDVAASLVTELFPAGRTLFAAGDPADKLYLIVRGAVDIVARAPSGGERILMSLDDGDYFGESSLRGGVRRAGARTSEPTLFWTLHQDQVARLAQQHPEVLAAFPPPDA